MDSGLSSSFCLFRMDPQFYFQVVFPNHRKRTCILSKSINQMPITVYFQRATVILSEIPFLLVLFWIFKEINAKMIIAYFSIPFILLDSNAYLK